MIKNYNYSCRYYSGKGLGSNEICYLADIVNIADYSPFGVQLDGRTITSEKYRYGFEEDIMGTQGIGFSGREINQAHYDNFGEAYSNKDSGKYILTENVDVKKSDGSVKGGESDGARPIPESGK